MFIDGRYGNKPFDTWADLIDSSIKIGQLIQRGFGFRERFGRNWGTARLPGSSVIVGVSVGLEYGGLASAQIEVDTREAS